MQPNIEVEVDSQNISRLKEMYISISKVENGFYINIDNGNRQRIQFIANNITELNDTVNKSLEKFNE